MNDKSEILKEIKLAVLQIDSNAEVVLFGSRARGDFHEESDWDVLILVDKDEKDYEFKEKIRGALFELELEFGECITGIVRNRNFWEDISVTPLYKEIEKDGIVL